MPDPPNLDEITALAHEAQRRGVMMSANAEDVLALVEMARGTRFAEAARYLEALHEIAQTTALGPGLDVVDDLPAHVAAVGTMGPK
jgi:hypothetical protein